MNDRNPNDTPSPVADGWSAARENTLTASLAATPAQRLEWLEEMIELAFQTGALPRRNE